MPATFLDDVSGVIQLKKIGRHWVGLCPFHHERTPSFMVDEETERFQCFGCGVGGNRAEFLARVQSPQRGGI